MRVQLLLLVLAWTVGCGSPPPKALPQGKVETKGDTTPIDVHGWNTAAVKPKARQWFEEAELGLAESEDVDFNFDDWGGGIGTVTVTNNRASPIWYFGDSASAPFLDMVKWEGGRWMRWSEFGICDNPYRFLRLDPGQSVTGKTLPTMFLGPVRIGVLVDNRDRNETGDTSSVTEGDGCRRVLWGPIVQTR